jgi:hypothetical protein
MIDQPGPTGDFPQGKLNADDEGALNIAISQEKGVVRIDFGKPIEWLAMPPDLAFDFASTILVHARRLKLDEEGQ